jgi:FixJ family two-component response regulator
VTSTTPRKVGIVDDDEPVRDSFRFLLEVSGYEVETFASAAELLASETDRPTCLIVDHHMPQTTGLDLVQLLRAAGIDVPILLITGAPSRAIDARAAELGVRVLEKPPNDQDVIDFVASASPSGG